MKILDFINQKSKNCFSIFKLMVKSQFQKSLKYSDYKRWGNNKSLHDSWNERTIMLAKKIPQNSKIFEFGAGNRILKKHISETCEYNHADMVLRDADTMIIDLNKQLPAIDFVDFVVFIGVLEYVHDIEKVFMKYSHFTNNILLSYACLDEFPKKSFRRAQGWVSDYYKNDFLILSKKLNFDFEEIGTWKNQKLIHLYRKN